MSRLESLSRDLADKLRHASRAKQRAAVLAACEFAIGHAKVAHAFVENALTKVRATGTLGPKDKAELDTLAARPDQEYFALREAGEELGASTDDYKHLFGQARAVAALSFGGEKDGIQAAMEAIYEAAAATDNKEEFLVFVESELQ